MKPIEKLDLILEKQQRVLLASKDTDGPLALKELEADPKSILRHKDVPSLLDLFRVPVKKRSHGANDEIPTVDPSIITLSTGDKVKAKNIEFSRSGRMSAVDLAVPAMITLPTGDKAEVMRVVLFDNEKIKEVVLSKAVTLMVGGKPVIFKKLIRFTGQGEIQK